MKKTVLILLLSILAIPLFAQPISEMPRMEEAPAADLALSLIDEPIESIDLSPVVVQEIVSEPLIVEDPVVEEAAALEPVVEEVPAELPLEEVVVEETPDPVVAAVDEVINEVSLDRSLSDFDIESLKQEIVDEVRSSLASEFHGPMTQSGVFFDGFAHATLLREKNFVPGGTIAFGYRDGLSLYSLYTRFDYFLSPLGSDTGRLATIEFMVEPGISFEYVVMSQDWQELKLSVDLGYYIQYIERFDEASVFYLSHNGLMARPTISAKANLYLFRIELGLYYQSAVYPRYKDYDGFGIYLKLF